MTPTMRSLTHDLSLSSTLGEALDPYSAKKCLTAELRANERLVKCRIPRKKYTARRIQHYDPQPVRLASFCRGKMQQWVGVLTSMTCI